MTSHENPPYMLFERGRTYHLTKVKQVLLNVKYVFVCFLKKNVNNYKINKKIKLLPYHAYICDRYEY